MRRAPVAAGVIAGWLLAAAVAHAQDLPPPPPPPLQQGSDLPPPPLPPTGRPPAAQPRRETTPPTPAPRPGPRREVVTVYEEPVARPVSVTINPLALLLGRLGANVEFLLAPHHSLVLSPNVLAFDVDRGGRWDLRSEGMGFATERSGSFGGEVGYHYWWRGRQSLMGAYLGPSLLLGTMTDATVGGGGTRLYWGGAFDAGAQAVLGGGATLGAGLGLGVVDLASVTAVFPRLLLQVGWSF